MDQKKLLKSKVGRPCYFNTNMIIWKGLLYIDFYKKNRRKNNLKMPIIDIKHAKLNDFLHIINSANHLLPRYFLNI